MTSLVEIIVVLEKIKKKWEKFTTLMTTARDSGQKLIRKAHGAFGSVEIKQIVSELTCNLSQVFGKSCIN